VVRLGTRGPRRLRKKKSKKWWGRYRDENGAVRRVPLAVDKMAAQSMLNECVRKVELKKAGLSDPFEDHRKRPLAEHLADFHRYLKAKGNTSKHARQTCNRVQALIDGCRFGRMADLSPSVTVQWLADERQAGRLGIQTTNYYLRDVKAFCNWLVKDGRTDRNPLAHLSGMNAQTDIRLERRSLPENEICALVAAARTSTGRSLQWMTKCGDKSTSKTIRVPGGLDRAMLYTVAAGTGFRACEMASLTTESFDLDSKLPTVTIEAAYSKRRRTDTQPLRQDLAAVVSVWLKDKPVAERLWPGNWWKHAARMVRADLEAARTAWIAKVGGDEEERKRREQSSVLAYRDSAGRVFDFHSLRHQFISNLAAAGVHPKAAQLLARHSTIKLTMDRYTHMGLCDLAASVNALPSIPIEETEWESRTLKATGTEGGAGFEVPTVVPSGAEGSRPLRDAAGSGLVHILGAVVVRLRAGVTANPADTDVEQPRLIQKRVGRNQQFIGASASAKRRAASLNRPARYNTAPRVVSQRTLFGSPARAFSANCAGCVQSSTPSVTWMQVHTVASAPSTLGAWPKCSSMPAQALRKPARSPWCKRTMARAYQGHGSLGFTSMALARIMH
jgi:integrase